MAKDHIDFPVPIVELDQCYASLEEIAQALADAAEEVLEEDDAFLAAPDLIAALADWKAWEVNGLPPPATKAGDLVAYLPFAASIVDSQPVMSIYAACEWDCLDDDGKLWIAAIVREALVRKEIAADFLLKGVANDG